MGQSAIMTRSLEDSLKRIRWILDAVPGALTMARWLRRNLDAELRTIHALSRAQGNLMFQTRPDTWEDRYPQLFAALANRLAHIAEPRILSFGCSNGAEVRSLRRYLPHALITGVDINPRCIARAQRADKNPLSRYLVAGKPDQNERYHAILAMAVFRHGVLETKQPDNCESILSFARFSEGISMLDRCLEPDGWLAIYNGHFRFTDTLVANGYAVDSFRMTDQPPLDLLYGPDNCRLTGRSYGEVLFRKLRS